MPHAATRAVVALHVVQGIPVGSRLLLELDVVALAAAEEDRDAIVGTRHDHGYVFGSEPRRGLAAQAIGHYDGVVPLSGGRVDTLLQPAAQNRRRVVQAALKKLHIDDMRRLGRAEVERTSEHFAGQAFQTHEYVLRSN